MGLVELAGSVRNVGKLIVSYAKPAPAKTDLLVLIDFPEFNLRLAIAKKLKIPVLYYISPQIWAVAKGRVRQIARCVDHMAVVFPLKCRFTKGGVKVSFVVTPSSISSVRAKPVTLCYAQLALMTREANIAILPGSRRAKSRITCRCCWTRLARLSQDSDLQFL
jgi:lipid-A-disaccharide synthase